MCLASSVPILQHNASYITSVLILCVIYSIIMFHCKSQEHYCKSQEHYDTMESAEQFATW